jgi:hypothetical protein
MQNTLKVKESNYQETPRRTLYHRYALSFAEK